MSNSQRTNEIESQDSSLGRRDRGKLEKYRRIVQAARDVFREKGFEAATTREIAERADIAIATLFVYAKDKRDLLFLLINDELDTLLQKQFDVRPKDGSLLGQILHIFACQYEYFASDAVLFRAALHESFHFDSDTGKDGPQVQRWRERHERGMDYLKNIIAANQASGCIRPEVDPATAAWLLVSIYRAQTLRWLSGKKPTAKKGISELREVMELLVNGLEK